MNDRDDPRSRALARWQAAAHRPRQIVCVGDSLTQDPPASTVGVTRGWVEQLADACDDGPGYGFRPLWLGKEWTRSGTWSEPSPEDPFDVAPFGRGLYSSGTAVDSLRWTKPAAMKVRAFALYWFDMPGMGAWQYRFDGTWRTACPAPGGTDFRLHKFVVNSPIEECVEIRGYDGNAPCIAPIAGIASYSLSSSHSTATTVHNLGAGHATLRTFTRATAGDRLALLDDLRPDVLIVLFSNDLIFDDPDGFGERLQGLVERVDGFADVLLISPYEQQPTDRENRLGDMKVGQRSRSMQAQYRAVTRSVAAANGCAYINLYECWAEGEGWDAAMRSGLMYDDLHPSQAGHDDIARRVQSMLGL